MAHSAVLTSNLDGATPLELVAGPTEGIWLAPEGEGLFVPPAYTETYASAPGTEGGIRTRSDPENVVGTGKVYFTGATQAAFWANIATFEQTIEQCRRYGGTLAYEPDSGPAITYEIESAHLLSLPQRGHHLGQRHAESDFELVFKPYGLLPSVEVDLMDRDSFSRDTITEGRWEVTPPAGDPFPGGLAVSGGVVVPTTTNASYGSRTSISMSDGTVTAKFLTGTNDVGHGRVWGRWTGPNVHWFAFDFNIQSNLTRLRYRAPNPIGEVSLPTTGAGTLSTSTHYWAQIEFSGNDIEGRLYDVDPIANPSATPISTRTHTLTGADAVALGEGIYGSPGFGIFNHTDLDWEADDFRAVSAEFRSTEPMLEFEIPEQDGSVDALVEIHASNINEDLHNYAFIEWGMEATHWSADYSWPLLIDDSDMTVLESATKQTGTGVEEWNATQIQQLSVGTTSKGIAGVSSQHIGRFHVKARLHPTELNVFARLAYSYRGGGTEFLPWVEIPGQDNWFEVDLGVVNIPPPEQGDAHSASFSVYAKAGGTTATVWLDYLKFFPAERYGVGSDSDPNVHDYLCELKLTHNGIWVESEFGSNAFGRVTGYSGSYVKVPPEGARFALYEAATRLDTTAHSTGFLDDEVAVTSIITTPRVALLGE